MSSRKKQGRVRIVGIAMLSLLGVVGVMSACSNNGEGERCEFGNGNDDCEDGLTCIPSTQLVAPFNSADRCCPANRANATTAACSQGIAFSDAAPPSEASPPDTGVVDSGDAGDASDGARDASDADAADADDDGG